MHLFVNKIQVENTQENTSKSSVQFKAKVNKNTVTEISDDIFKIASAAIAAAGIATLGINSKEKENSEKKDEPQIVNRSYLANEILHVNLHSVNWHIKKKHLVVTEDNKIDLNNPTNRLFIENFQKGKRVNQEVFGYSPEQYEQLQAKLGKKLPLEYCLKHGLLIADDDGIIRTDNEQNKEFLDKIQSKEINYRSFFMSKEEYSNYLDIALISVTRAIGKKRIKVNPDTQRIDINDPINLEFQKNVEAAKQDAKDRNLGRPVSFSEQKPKNNDPSKYTLKELAQKLGYSQPSCLSYHIANGRIVVENGLVDISIEPNKSFYSAKLSGRLQPRHAVIGRKKVSQPEENPNIKSRSFVAKELLEGISVTTLMYHVRQGHLVLTKDGKIDITDERNKFFLENHKKGIVLYPNTPVNPLKKHPKVNEPTEKNPNYITMTELSYVTGLTQWPLVIHAEKGRIIRDADGIDITNPTNKFFINKYEENGLEKLDKMSLKDLRRLKQKIEYRYQSLIPKEIYLQAKDAKNKSEEEFDIYIKNTLFTMFRVEILSSQELHFIENIVKNIIQTRLDDTKKPVDFSDIKDFSLTDVIELEHELNIIDKLIDVEKRYDLQNVEIEKFKNNSFKKENLEKLKDVTNIYKKDLPKDIIDKIKAYIKEHKKIGVELIDYEKMSIDDLKQRLIEFYNDKKFAKNTVLENLISFMYDYEFETEEEKEILVNFTKELHSYVLNNKDEDFSKEILEKVKELENNFRKKEEKKLAVFERVNIRLNDCINLLYANGLVKAAETCYNYIPKNPDATAQINQAVHVIELAFALNNNITLPTQFENKSQEEKNAELERLNNKRHQEIEDTILGFDLENFNSQLLEDAKKYSMKRYGVVEDKYLGEYVRHINNIENCDFSSYPEFCKKLYTSILDMNKKDAVTILSKLDEWNYLCDSEKKKFRNLSKLFSKDNPVELEFLTEYIQNYYKNFDTIIIAVNIKDSKTRIPATLSIKAKDMMLKKVVLNELPDYFDAFEYSMQKIVPDGNGIKEHNTKKHEVRISLPARLYSPKKDFYFDDFEYHAHQGSKS